MGLSASLIYATSLFERSTVERLAAHWRNLLEAICREPARRVGELPLLDRSERDLLLARWVAQVVVTAVQCQVALVDAIHTHVLACDAVQPTGQDRTSAVTVLQAADLVGQARVGVPSTGYLTAQEAQRDISHYLMHRYNWIRPHQFNDGLPPAVAEEKLNPLSGMG